MNNNIVLKCTNIGKSYRDGSLNVQVLKNLNLEVKEGEGISIIGSSGSGKSTLLHILGGLDKRYVSETYRLCLDESRHKRYVSETTGRIAQ